MQYIEKIDWLTLSKKPEVAWRTDDPIEFGHGIELARESLFTLVGKFPLLKTVPASGFYALAFRDEYTGARVDIGEFIAEQGMKVVFSGDALKRCDAAAAVLSRALEDGWRVTRIDFATDLVGQPYEVSDYISEVMARLEGNRQVSTAVFTGMNGDTLYIGSRKSARMMRIYDKAKEQGLDISWVRLEAELKDYAAHPAAVKYMQDRKYALAVVVELSRLSGSPLIKPLEDALAGYEYAATKAPMTKPDRLKWFQNQVSAAMANLAQEDPMAAIEALQAMADALEDGWEAAITADVFTWNPMFWYDSDK